MFPISDVNESSSIPFVNYFLIAINCFIFYLQITAYDFEHFIRNYGFIASQFSLFDPASYANIIYSMFMHGSWFHLLSNMWFLHIFGDNVEDALGHLQYALFYIVFGVCAIFSQYALNTQSTIPMIGASGAISGVTGAYFAIFRNAKIKALMPTFLGFWDIVALPAWFFLGYWFFIQVLSGFGSLSSIDEGGVAFFAHIGGFVAGYISAKLLIRSSVVQIRD